MESEICVKLLTLWLSLSIDEPSKHRLKMCFRYVVGSPGLGNCCWECENRAFDPPPPPPCCLNLHIPNPGLRRADCIYLFIFKSMYKWTTQLKPVLFKGRLYWHYLGNFKKS